MNTRLSGTVSTLRVAIGLMAALAALDKFFNLLTNWEGYIAPVAQQLLPFSTTTSMAIVGVIECAVGMTILVIRPSLGAFVASAWLVLVAVNLVLAVSAYSLARFEQVRETAPAAAAVGQRRTVTA